MNDVANYSERSSSKNADVEGEYGGADEKDRDSPGKFSNENGLLRQDLVTRFLALGTSRAILCLGVPHSVSELPHSQIV